MKVEDIMNRAVASCLPAMNLAEASALMWEYDCGALPVMTQTGELAGIVTDRDICIALGTRNVQPSLLTVREVFKDHPAVCRTGDDIDSALKTMRERKVRRLPVLGESMQLQGILSIDDVLLNARRSAGGGPSFISHDDVIETLQAICARARYLSKEAAAAVAA